MEKRSDNNKRDSKSILITFTIVILILLFVIAFVSYKFIKNSEEKENNSFENLGKIATLNGSKLISMTVPAVSEDGEGVKTFLILESIPGTGRTLVSIDNLLFWADTQSSIRTARKVASDVTNIDVNKYDLIYSIHANASVVGGPSAGAALTVLTIAALRNKEINPKVMISGVINHDGSIGPVSDISKKAKVVKELGFEIFLVPLSQSKDVIYEEKEHCEKFGGVDFCQKEQIPKQIDLAKEYNLTVVEIANINEALEWFFY
ncbi:hypothetical protein CO154_01585 [Candidatus Pacearchaeota archaeon CG_4_9_14_3_um_filter_31_7]|nr:MAG: hypothetical protein AUJ10_01395 [Candidatus Pacearchaeota archaeon CG1_02_31_27]PIN92009.1 MAG: hypothetical protein COU55_03020 [Candidatus Pacearchaeota archaeon CG10_big_fil_rev_8_21_14_0_10_31_59]PIZ81093.1 MAG: hypothetical protein COX99_00630 [Candidatus Pacearchaeota archaeon CG_4_10_14_0_2_um_filter_31_10]PJA70681.1 MAG: hypothetical protein CO154_01585 [Candidatus Pacearchaeota archaeon CG_4_9_14_3_um_filter_31_7]